MAKVTLEEIKNLRTRSGAGISDCKEALESANGNEEKAVEFLRKKGILKSKKRASRVASNGFVFSYVHSGRIGVLVEVMCETDFAAKSDVFQKLGKELTLQVAAASPSYVRIEDVPEKDKKEEEKVIKEKLIKEGKPKAMLEKISQGFLQKYYEEVCLLEQPYIREGGKKVKDIVDEAVAAICEKIEITRFLRLELGEDQN